MKTNLIQTLARPALVAGLALAVASAPLLRGAAAQNEQAKEQSQPGGTIGNRVLALDGEKGYMQVPDSPSLHTLSKSIALEVWCLAHSFYPQRGSVNSVLRKNVQAEAENFFLRIRNTDDRPLIEFGLGGGLGVLQAPADVGRSHY